MGSEDIDRVGYNRKVKNTTLERNVHSVVLYRSSYDNAAEKATASKEFVVYSNRTSITGGDLVVGRYSVLPFYAELEVDVKSLGGNLINTYEAHRWIADIHNWYDAFSDTTPETWFSFSDVPEDTPLILKGSVNSRKDKWMSHMFARNKRDAGRVHANLLDDPLIVDQGVVFRRFIKFQNYGNNPITQQPITKEFRLFILDGEVMASGFYWASCLDLVKERNSGGVPSAKEQVPQTFINSIIERLHKDARFVVVDVAQRQEDNQWMVVELNDGQMSGLTTCNATELYKNMKKKLWWNNVRLTP